MSVSGWALIPTSVLSSKVLSSFPSATLWVALDGSTFARSCQFRTTVARIAPRPLHGRTSIRAAAPTNYTAFLGLKVLTELRKDHRWADSAIDAPIDQEKREPTPLRRKRAA